jgi:hypothetical protein
MSFHIVPVKLTLFPRSFDLDLLTGREVNSSENYTCQRRERFVLLGFPFPIKQKVDHPCTPAGRNQQSVEFLPKRLHGLLVVISTLSSMVKEESLEFTYETGKRMLAKV